MNKYIYVHKDVENETDSILIGVVGVVLSFVYAMATKYNKIITIFYQWLCYDYYLVLVFILVVDNNNGLIISKPNFTPLIRNSNNDYDYDELWIMMREYLILLLSLFNIYYYYCCITIEKYYFY